MSLNVAFSKDGQLLAAGGGNSYQGGGLIVWDANTWNELYADPALGAPVAFSADGKHLAAVRADFGIDIREATTGRAIRSLRGHSWVIWDVAFASYADISLLASASGDGTVRIWDVRTGKEITGLPALAASTVTLGASPREAGVLSAAALTAQKVENTPPLRHTNGVLCMAFSPDGRLLASGGRGGVVNVWDAKSWQLLHELRDFSGSVRSVAFHPNDRRLLAWGSSDATVKLWDVTTKQTHTLHGHKNWVEGVAFSPDGAWLASASLDGTVRIWKTPPLAGRDIVDPR
jgi:WD40 repeat protein